MVPVGITFSTTDDLKRWRDEVGLASVLLSDADRSVAMAYGAADSPDQAKAKRVSILIGPDGKVIDAFTPGDAGAHAGEVIDAL